ncbi:MAG: DUF4911 domain-containing protein [Syntrophomonadaceae bacterium]|nr:DUF4911 domain-containing protein [Syntrophomonadaceae bacterium]
MRTRCRITPYYEGWKNAIKADIYVNVAPEKIDLLSKIIEAYEHLGIVSTLDPLAGMLVIRTTPDTSEDIVGILLNLPFPVQILPHE